MKKIASSALFLLVVLFLSTPVLAQKKLKKGKITYKLDLAEMKDNPMMAMIGDVNISFLFDPGHQRMDVSMMGMVSMKVIQTGVASAAKGVVLLDMLGQKYQITDLDPTELLNQGAAKKEEEVKINHYKKDRKKILGYKCCRAEAVSGNGFKMEFYVSNKIKSSLPTSLGNLDELKGFPLEIIITSPDGSINRLTATDISPNILETAFEVESGYKKITAKEMEEELGGMFNL